MKTTRKKAAENAVIKLVRQNHVLTWEAIRDCMVHVMKAEHARHARGNVCIRKKITGGKIIKVRWAEND